MWYQGSCAHVHNLKAFKHGEWLRYCTWGRETKASRSSIAALNLRSWSRRNWMSEAGVSRSWTHNSTQLLTSHIDNSSFFDQQNHKDLCMRWLRLDYICSLQFPLQNKNSLSGTEKPLMRSDLHTSGNALYLLLQRLQRNDYNLMLPILIWNKYFFIQQLQSF